MARDSRHVVKDSFSVMILFSRGPAFSSFLSSWRLIHVVYMVNIQQVFVGQRETGLEKGM